MVGEAIAAVRERLTVPCVGVPDGLVGVADVPEAPPQAASARLPAATADSRRKVLLLSFRLSMMGTSIVMARIDRCDGHIGRDR